MCLHTEDGAGGSRGRGQGLLREWDALAHLFCMNGLMIEITNQYPIAHKLPHSLPIHLQVNPSDALEFAAAQQIQVR